jgi:hypothetical protein
MTIPITISKAAEERFGLKAAAAGQDIATYLGRLIENLAVPPLSLHEISGPLGEEFKRSGMSEDDLSDLLDGEKDAARAARRSNGKAKG